MGPTFKTIYVCNDPSLGGPIVSLRAEVYDRQAWVPEWRTTLWNTGKYRTWFSTEAAAKAHALKEARKALVELQDAERDLREKMEQYR